MDMTQETREYDCSLFATSNEGIDHVKRVIVDAGITIVQEIEPKEIRLAYPIAKHTAALFTVLRIAALPDRIAVIRKELDIIPGVLRAMITHAISSQASGVGFGVPAGTRKPSSRSSDAEQSRPVKKRVPEAVTNEELEKKLEEILN